MQIINRGFRIEIIGKCEKEIDVLQLFNFGMSKENVIKKYKKDNKIKIDEARSFVEHVLYRNIMKGVN